MNRSSLSATVLAFILTSAAGGQALPPQSRSGLKPVDVVALMDSSPSTRGTDPRNERLDAFRFLIEYLSATSEAFSLNHRVAFASFGGTVRTALPLTLLNRDSLSLPRPEEIPFTDFRPPLEFAVRELAHGSDPNRGRIVVLFTDGRPALPGFSTGDRNLADSELARYFAGTLQGGSGASLPALVEQLQEAGADLYVVTIGGDQSARREWERVLRDHHYIEVDSPRSLTLAYYRILASHIGFGRLEQRRLEAGTTLPYVSQPAARVSVAVIKDSANVQTQVHGSSNDVLRPLQRGPGAARLVDLYDLEPATLKGGLRFHASGGGAQLLIATQPLQVSLTPFIGTTRSPVEIYAQIPQPGYIPEELTLIGKLSGPGLAKDQAHPFKALGAGRFRLKLTGLHQPGEYSLGVEGVVRGTTVPLLSLATPLIILDPPNVLRFNAKPSPDGFLIELLLSAGTETTRRASIAAVGEKGATLAIAPLAFSSKEGSELAGTLAIPEAARAQLQHFEITIEDTSSELPFQMRFVQPAATMAASSQGGSASYLFMALLAIPAMFAAALGLNHLKERRGRKRILSAAGLGALERTIANPEEVIPALQRIATDPQYHSPDLRAVAEEALSAMEKPGKREAWAQTVACLIRSARPEFWLAAEDARRRGFRQLLDPLEDEALLSKFGAYPGGTKHD